MVIITLAEWAIMYVQYTVYLDIKQPIRSSICIIIWSHAKSMLSRNFRACTDSEVNTYIHKHTQFYLPAYKAWLRTYQNPYKHNYCWCVTVINVWHEKMCQVSNSTVVVQYLFNCCPCYTTWLKLMVLILRTYVRIR